MDVLFPLRRLHGFLYDINFNRINNSKMRKYKDRYFGKRCFILGNGPSLSIHDIKTLHDNNEITFATNRIYLLFPNVNWRPTFYVCEDINIARNHESIISNIEAKEKFVPRELSSVWGINIANATYFHMNYDPKHRTAFGFSEDITKQIDCRGTVTCTCMQIAAYMGFSEIYLLGVDHNYRVTIDINGNTVIDPTAKDYFLDNYDADIKDIAQHNIGDNTRAYLDAQKYCLHTKKTAIYNATRGGKLEVFDRVDFDSLF